MLDDSHANDGVLDFRQSTKRRIVCNIDGIVLSRPIRSIGLDPETQVVVFRQLDGRREGPVVRIQDSVGIRLADKRIVTGDTSDRVREPVVAIAIVVNEGPAVRTVFEIPQERHIDGVDLVGSEADTELGEAAVRELDVGRKGNLFLIDALVGNHLERRSLTGSPVTLGHDAEPDDVVTGSLKAAVQAQGDRLGSGSFESALGIHRAGGGIVNDGAGDVHGRIDGNLMNILTGGNAVQRKTDDRTQTTEGEQEVFPVGHAVGAMVQRRREQDVRIRGEVVPVQSLVIRHDDVIRTVVGYNGLSGINRRILVGTSFAIFPVQSGFKTGLSIGDSGIIGLGDTFYGAVHDLEYAHIVSGGPFNSRNFSVNDIGLGGVVSGNDLDGNAVGGGRILDVDLFGAGQESQGGNGQAGSNYVLSHRFVLLQKVIQFITVIEIATRATRFAGLAAGQQNLTFEDHLQGFRFRYLISSFHNRIRVKS